MKKNDAEMARAWLVAHGIHGVLAEPIRSVRQEAVEGRSVAETTGAFLAVLLGTLGALPPTVRAEVRPAEGLVRLESLGNGLRVMIDDVPGGEPAAEDGVLSVPLDVLARASTWAIVDGVAGRIILMDERAVVPFVALPGKPKWPPVDGVLATIAHDDELLRALEGERAPVWPLGDAIVAAVAATSSRAADPKAALQAVLAGGALPAEREAAAWLASWEPDERRRLVSLATTSAESLRADLQEIEYEEEDSVRNRNVGELARSRERLEALQRLLGTAPDVDAEPLRAQLRAADAAGERLVTITPALPELGDDVVLVRAAIADPLRWWSRLVPMPHA